MAKNKTKEPTNQDIMYEIKRTHAITLLSLYATAFFAGCGLWLSTSSLAPANLFGLFLMMAGFYFFFNIFVRNRHHIGRRNK